MSAALSQNYVVGELGDHVVVKLFIGDYSSFFGSDFLRGKQKNLPFLG